MKSTEQLLWFDDHNNFITTGHYIVALDAVWVQLEQKKTELLMNPQAYVRLSSIFICLRLRAHH
jgi:hypothetical protein